MNHFCDNKSPWGYGLILLGCLYSLSTWASDLVGSGQHSLAISANQPFGYAWGANQAGQLGRDSGGETQPYPFLWSPAGTGTVWTQVASGDWHSVALAADGTVWTWGQNGQGQLGDGTTMDHPIPVPVPGLSHAIAVAAGKYHSLVVTEDGRVWAWGNNDYRQLGNNGSQGQTALTPVAVVVAELRSDGGLNFPPLTGVVAVAASEVHSVALKGDGTVWAWGDNSSGQLGTCTTFAAATAKPVWQTCGANPLPLTGVRQISAGGYHRAGGYTEQRGVAYTIAVRDDGTIWGWGNNEHCQLGENSWLQQTTPQGLPNLNQLGTLRVLAGGDAHGAALTPDGQVWTWGDNTHGQLGDGAISPNAPRCQPQPVQTITDGETLGAGPAQTLLTRRDGTVWAWGRNNLGQLGDGATQDRGTPAPVSGICGVGHLNLQAVPPAGCPVTLATTGVGQGTVAGAGDYAADVIVTLTATPAADSALAGWSPSPCAASFTMPNPARALTCTAKFTNTVTYPVTLATTGEGRGAVDGGGAYATGEIVVLTAKPNPRSQFTGWSPAPCAARFTMLDESLTCTATFEPQPIIPLTVVRAGDGDGTVSGGGQYQVGEIVTLTATLQSDHDHFAGWTPEPCAAVFTMPDQPLTCTATFIADAADPLIAAHLEHYYTTILDRLPASAEQTSWANDLARIQTLGIDVGDGFRTLIQQLFTSAEYQSRYRSDTQYVTDLYRALLQRDPDPDRVNDWLAQLAAGLPRDVVLTDFLFAAEFTAYLQGQFGAAISRVEALTVVDFYRGLLNRLPDNAGFRYWLERFQTAQCQGAAAVTAEVEAISSQFANSPEYLNRQRPNREYLQDLYSTFLRRGADREGFNYWLNRLDTGDLTREQARQFFVAAPEFQGRVSQIIQQGCLRMPFIQISAGSNHACGVRADGAVACWGGYEYGYGEAMPPSGVFTQVSAGGYHTCGVKTDGTVTCWGNNEDGQTTPPTGTFTQVSAGSEHACGVQTAGTVACWGNNDKGEATPPTGTFTQISAGGSHTCGVRVDGAVACWGENYFGEATPPTGSFTQVSAGGRHTCGVKIDGTVACWGDGNYGQATPPTGTFSHVSAGSSTFHGHSCGVKRDGTVECWGSNDPPVTDLNVTSGQAIPPVGIFTAVSAGGGYTCGLRDDGMVACWGWNSNGQASPPNGAYYVPLEVVVTGPGTVTSLPTGIACGNDCRRSYELQTLITLTATPVDGAKFSHWNGACSGAMANCQVVMSQAQSVEAVFISANPRSYTQVSAGSWYTCGLQSDGVGACWGWHYFAIPPAGAFIQISAGGLFFGFDLTGHICGVKLDGTVACSGSNDYGQASPPAGIFTQVSAGGHHTCGVNSDSVIVCWGDNQYDQASPPAGTFIQVSAGWFHTCGVKTDGTVACWGSENNDPVFRSNIDSPSTPPAGTFTHVSGGWFHTCGVKTEGTVACWGDNEYGQSTPPDSVFTQISAGALHTCGVKTDGAIACWGYNFFGQADRPAGAFVHVSAGFRHTCGVTTDRRIMCWGDNEYGQSTPPDDRTIRDAVGVFRVETGYRDPE